MGKVGNLLSGETSDLPSKNLKNMLGTLRFAQPTILEIQMGWYITGTVEAATTIEDGADSE